MASGDPSGTNVEAGAIMGLEDDDRVASVTVVPADDDAGGEVGGARGFSRRRHQRMRLPKALAASSAVERAVVFVEDGVDLDEFDRAQLVERRRRLHRAWASR